MPGCLQQCRVKNDLLENLLALTIERVQERCGNVLLLYLRISLVTLPCSLLAVIVSTVGTYKGTQSFIGRVECS